MERQKDKCTRGEDYAKIVYIIRKIHSQLPQPTVAPFHYMLIYLIQLRENKGCKLK